MPSNNISLNNYKWVDSREIPVGDDRGCGEVGGALVMGGWSCAIGVELPRVSRDWCRHWET